MPGVYCKTHTVYTFRGQRQQRQAIYYCASSVRYGLMVKLSIIIVLSSGPLADLSSFSAHSVCSELYQM